MPHNVKLRGGERTRLRAGVRVVDVGRCYLVVRSDLDLERDVLRREHVVDRANIVDVADIRSDGNVSGLSAWFGEAESNMCTFFFVRFQKLRWNSHLRNHYS